jgi:hypothetical protein
VKAGISVVDATVMTVEAVWVNVVVVQADVVSMQEQAVLIILSTSFVSEARLFRASSVLIARFWGAAVVVIVVDCHEDATSRPLGTDSAVLINYYV